MFAGLVVEIPNPATPLRLSKAVPQLNPPSVVLETLKVEPKNNVDVFTESMDSSAGEMFVCGSPLPTAFQLPPPSVVLKSGLSAVAR
jgi:hypothetical protein